MSRLSGPRSLLSALLGINGNSIRGVRHSGRRGRLRRAAELAHHTIPARMDALVVGALKSQQGRSQNGRRNKRNEAPQQIAGGRSRPKEMTQEQCKAALSATSSTGQGDRRAQQLDKGARGHDREKVDLVVAKGKHQEIRHEVEKRELQHGDDHREQHGRKMSGRKLELLGEGVDLAIDKRAPSLDLSGRDTNALKPIDDAVGDARDGLRHERDGEDAKQDAAVPTKAKDAQQRHVAIALGKKGHASKQ